MLDNEITDNTISRRDTDIVLSGYKQDNNDNISNNTRKQRDNTTVAVTSVVDHIIINNIEEEEDEIDDHYANTSEHGNEKESATKRDHSHKMNKSLSKASSIGKNYT